MSDTTLWVKLRSWHVLANGMTRCGRVFVVPSPTADDLPMGERSCETCLRLTAHDAEKAGA